MTDAAFKLPVSLATRADAGRALRELEAVIEFLEQGAIRQPGSTMTMPKTSKLMHDLVEVNQLNLLRQDDRQQLAVFLDTVIQHAPQLHMSFSSEPSHGFMTKLTTYIRDNIHPVALLQIGLQPTIGAGFMLRTTNKYYDFSLRKTLEDRQESLLHNLRATDQAPATQIDEAKP